ncbi:MAG: molybdopterin-dependent oxidoreductase [Coriobacteriales bacterium]
MDSEWKKVLDDGTEVIRTCAWSPPGCHPVGCGLRLFVKDGKLVKVEGDPEQPVTKGRLCVRCLTLKEYIYHPDRIIYPMKRDKADRGKDKWVRTTWDEALDIICDALRKNIANYGYEGSCLFVGTGRQAAINSATGANNVLRTPHACYAFSGYSCYGPRNAAVNFVVGSGIPEMDYAAGLEGRYDDPEYEIPKYILIWGKDPLKTNPDGLWGNSLMELKRLGTKLIVVDPRMTWLATRADIVLRLRPGTDAALALGIANVIVEEDLYDHEFVEKWTYGFDKFAERVKEYPPEKVAEICEVPAELIRKTARAVSQKPSSLTWGLAVDESDNGMQCGQTLLCIEAITGNLDIPGGTLLGPVLGLGGADESNLPTIVDPEVRARKIGSDRFPAFNTVVNAVQPDLFLETLETDKPYPIRFAWIQSSNFLSPTCSAQPKRWRQALLKMDFIFATDLFMNPTIMALADVFLPVATFAEADGVVFTHYGANPMNISAINKAITVGETKSDAEICYELLKRLYPEQYPAPVDVMVHGQFSGMGAASGAKDFYELREIGTAQVHPEYRKYEKGMLRADGEPGFSTPTGMVELYSVAYKYLGEDPLPHYIEPKMSPINTPEYEFILSTGSRKYTSFHSEQRMIKSLRQIDDDPIIEMNPADAERKGIREGDWVHISNCYGEADYKVNITPIVKEGRLNAYHGWWFPEEDPEEPHLFGVWKSNVNTMCPHGDNSHMGFGAPLKSLMCNLEKLTEENRVSDNEEPNVREYVYEDVWGAPDAPKAVPLGDAAYEDIAGGEIDG